MDTDGRRTICSGIRWERRSRKFYGPAFVLFCLGFCFFIGFQIGAAAPGTGVVMENYLDPQIMFTIFSAKIFGLNCCILALR